MALTQVRSQNRSRFIELESITYRFHLRLHAGDTYEGFSEIQFGIKEVPQELTLDCQAKKVTRFFINEQEVKEFKHQDGFLYLDLAKLKVGKNHVAVFHESVYDNDGSGLVSFIDDTDGNKQYLYTQFQPYCATRVFPCFDQPDLKATMELSIVGPKEWPILSNQYASVEEEYNAQKFLSSAATFNCKLLEEFAAGHKEGGMTIFPKTKMLPTYLYCFVAGPYKRLEIPKDQVYKNIPMSLYCIGPLFEYMEKLAPFIFDVTIESLKFFESFFGVPYAFNKYDQVFARDYKAGAMENAGIVTFRDEYIFREQVSTTKKLDLANTISHELSHHWFGNLVTMKWWDDLWLNESFADFISHYCLEEIKGNLKTINYESSMVTFVQRKAWGYEEDEYSTTHPIRGEVKDTIVADSIFDGITYSKGAATLQQLLFLMGKQNFSAGLKDHFTKYAFKNATLDDFIKELEKHYNNPNLTLDVWKQEWLEKQSFNVLASQWDPTDSCNSAKLIIKQTPLTDKFKTLRPHQIKVAFFREDCTFDVKEVFVEAKEKTIVEYDGSQNYKAVLLNYEDHTFARIDVDKTSHDFFAKNVNRVGDVLTRSLIWNSFFQDVYNSREPVTMFVDLFCEHLSGQKSDSIWSFLFSKLTKVVKSYTPRINRGQIYSRIFYFILGLIPTIPADQENLLVILRQQLCEFAGEHISVDILRGWRKGVYPLLKNHQITIGQEWATVIKTFAQRNVSLAKKEKLLEEQEAKDQTAEANYYKSTCLSLKANNIEFEQIYASFKDKNNKKSVTAKEYQAAGWNHPYHMVWLKEYKEQYFKDVIECSEQLQGDHFQFFVTNICPIDDNLEETINGLKGIKLVGEKFEKVNKEIKKMIDRLERKVKTYRTLQESMA